MKRLVVLPIPHIRTSMAATRAIEMYNVGFAAVVIRMAQDYYNIHFGFVHPENGFVAADDRVEYDTCTLTKGVIETTVPRLCIRMAEYIEEHDITSALVIANNKTLDAFEHWADYSRITLTLLVQNLGIAYATYQQWLDENRVTHYSPVPRVPNVLTPNMWNRQTGMLNFRVVGHASFGGNTVTMTKDEVYEKAVEITKDWPPLIRVVNKYCIINNKIVSAVKLANALAGHDYMRVKSSNRAKSFLNRLGVAVFLASKGHQWR